MNENNKNKECTDTYVTKAIHGNNQRNNNNSKKQKQYMSVLYMQILIQLLSNLLPDSYSIVIESVIRLFVL